MAKKISLAFLMVLVLVALVGVGLAMFGGLNNLGRRTQGSLLLTPLVENVEDQDQGAGSAFGNLIRTASPGAVPSGQDLNIDSDLANLGTSLSNLNSDLSSISSSINDTSLDQP